MTRSIEPLLGRDVRESVGVLTRAFLDNPSTLALLPYAPARRRSALARVMRGFVEATRRAGEASIACAEQRPGGVMLAFGPQSYPVDLLAYAWLAFGPLTAGPRSMKRYLTADQLLRRLHPKRSHYYLFVLGVDPELQGRGIGSRLIEHLCARADRDALPCYLETDKESNVRLYERHGFDVEHEETEARLGVRFWTMLRQGSAVRKNAPR